MTINTEMPSLHPVYIIAEMACSPDGDPALAKTIIRGAGEAGAQAVQFQVWKREAMVVPRHPDFAKLGAIELSRGAWAELARFVRNSYPAMQIIACVYERDSVDFCESLPVDAYKLHAAEPVQPAV